MVRPAEGEAAQGGQCVHVCPRGRLPQHCSQPQLSLSSIDPPEGPHPPSPLTPTPGYRWMEGFPVPLSVILAISSPQLTRLHGRVWPGRHVCQGSVDCQMVLALASKPTQLLRSPLLPRSLQKWADHVTQIWATTRTSWEEPKIKPTLSHPKMAWPT